jgi:hypothetical protein
MIQVEILRIPFKLSAYKLATFGDYILTQNHRNLLIDFVISEFRTLACNKPEKSLEPFYVRLTDLVLGQRNFLLIVHQDP